jgi:hypothetical protein
MVTPEMADPAEVAGVAGTPVVQAAAPASGAARRLAAARPLVAGAVTCTAALALYLRTLMPDVSLWDTAEFQAIGPVLGIAHPTGFPTYTLLAWLASVVLQPFGEPALRANLLSTILVGLAVAAVAAAVTVLTRRAVLGIVAGAGLAVTTIGWGIALRADPHALHLALAAILLLLLVGWAERTRRGEPSDRWLLVASVVFGVSLGNHALTLLLAPGIALFVLVAAPAILRRPRFILTCATALALATVVLYAYLPLRSAMNPPLDYANPQTWEGFRYLVFAEQFRGDFSQYPPLAAALRSVGSETLAELGLLAVLGAVGVVAAALARPALFLLLGGWFTFNWAFALGYQNADIARYHLVPLLCVAVFAGLGAGALWRLLEAGWRRLADGGRGSSRTTPSGMPMVAPGPARVVASLLIGAALLAPILASVPPRFDRLDRSGPTDGRQWLDAVLPQLEPDAVIVSWWTYSTALWYAHFVDGARPDIRIVDDSTVVAEGLGNAQNAIDFYLPVRPVYIVRVAPDLPEFEQRYILDRLAGEPLTGHGQVYRVMGLRSGADLGSDL